MRFKFLPFLIIIFFIASSIFGFLIMSEMVHTECPLFKMLGGSCSSDTNAILLLTHHLAGLKVLSTSFIAGNFLSLLAVLFLVILLKVSSIFLHKLSSASCFSFRADKYIGFNPIRHIISWLALLNKGGHLLFLPA